MSLAWGFPDAFRATPRYRGTSVNGKTSVGKYFSALLWVAVVWITASGSAWAFEIEGVLDEPRASMVQFSKETGNWVGGDNELCYSNILPEDGKAATQWAELNSAMLHHLKVIIKDKAEEAKRHKLPDGGPPKWWRDLLAAYTTLMSYTPFREWEGHLGVIDSTYKLSDGRVYCFTSGDRGGWVIDSEFPDHVIFLPWAPKTSCRWTLMEISYLILPTSRQSSQNTLIAPESAPSFVLLWNQTAFSPMRRTKNSLLNIPMHISNIITDSKIRLPVRT